MAQLKLGTLIDRLGKADVAVKDANAVHEKAKAAKAKVETELYDRFSKHELDGASGKVFAVKLRRSKNPSLKDWKKLAAYVYRNKALDIFQRRLAKTAWLDRMAANNGKPIPGIVSYDVVKISVTKKR